MKLTRLQTYLAILASILLICLLYQSVWIFSRSTKAKVLAVTKPNPKKATWMTAEYQVDYTLYQRSFLKEDYDTSDFTVRYLIFAPGWARADTFASNWGPLMMFFAVCFLVTSIVFIRKDIISAQAICVISRSRPYIRIQNNLIKDYDEHDIENKTVELSNEPAKIKTAAEENATIASGIIASVYKYNETAIGIIVVYVFYFFWFFLNILNSSFGYPAIFFFGSILIFVPLYVQNTRNPRFKMKIPNEGALVFSTKGIIYKHFAYDLEHMESAVIYLESFKGFKHRQRLTTGISNIVEDGDNNKISFRYKGEVVDLTFILNNASDYWAFRKLAAIWSSNGINVFLRKVFEDEFVLQEEAYFHS